MNYPKTSILSVFVGLVIAGLFSATLYVFAIPTASMYNPGEASSPNCVQGSQNCSVNTPAYSFGSNNFSGTGNFTTTTGTITANTISVGSVYSFPTSGGTANQFLGYDSNGANFGWHTITNLGSLSGLVKGNGDGTYSAASAGVDYQAPLPSQRGHNGEFLTTNGSTLSWGVSPNGSWTEVTGTLHPTTTSDRVLLGGATDDTSTALQVNGNMYADELGINTGSSKKYFTYNNGLYFDGNPIVSSQWTESGGVLSASASTVSVAGTNGTRILLDGGTGNQQWSLYSIGSGGSQGQGTFLISNDATNQFEIKSNGHVLLGSSTDDGSSILQVNGDVNITGTYKINGTAISTNSGVTADAVTNNVYSGALGAGNGGTYTNAFGGSAGGTSTSANNNFFGYQAGYHTTGANNNFFGYVSGEGNTTGTNNFFAGFAAASINSVTGSDDIFIGNSAGYSNTTGHENNFLGFAAGFRNTTGYDNNFLGYATGSYSTTGAGNDFLGSSAGGNNTTGSYNEFIGYMSGFTNTTGGSNEFLGGNAGRNNNGHNNIFIGGASGYNQTSASNQLIIDAPYPSIRSNDLTQGLITGVFDASMTNQSLTINAATINMPYLNAGYAGAVKVDINGKLWVDSSSLRVKSNVQDLKDNWSEILQTVPKSFTYKPTGQQEIGYIAEDFNALGLTDLVNYDKNNLPSSINYDRITLYDTEILKQQQADINSLKLLAGLSIDGTATSGDSSGIVKQNSLLVAASQLLATVGINISNGVTSIANLAVNNLTVKTASITGGIEMTDKSNGDIYCTWIDNNGQWQKAKGDCASVMASLPATVTATAGSSPETATTEQIAQTQTAIQQTLNTVSQVSQQIQQVAQQQNQVNTQTVQQAVQQALQQQTPIAQVTTPAEAPLTDLTQTTTPATDLTQTTTPSDTADIIQNATSSLVNGFWSFVKWLFSSSAKTAVSAPIIQKSSASISGAFKILELGIKGK